MHRRRRRAPLSLPLSGPVTARPRRSTAPRHVWPRRFGAGRALSLAAWGFLLLAGCGEAPGAPAATDSDAAWAGPYTLTRTIGTGSVSVEAVVDKPAGNALDALLLFHGTVGDDSRVLEAAETTLGYFDAVLEREDMLRVSVAYPEEGLLFGDNVAHAEAALLWVRERAEAELGITVGKVFLAGHSQGGYIVTRLNTMHAVDGVIANAPGPLDLAYRCGLEEAGEVPAGEECSLLRTTYGTTEEAPEAYVERSLLSFTSGHRSDALFVQGMADTAIQLHTWPTFREQLEACSDCRARTFVEVPDAAHNALFASPDAARAFNDFLAAH